MARYQGDEVRKCLYFPLVILFTANVFGCTKQIGSDSVTDRKMQEDGEEPIYKRLYHIGEVLYKYIPEERSCFYNGKDTVRMQTFQMHKKTLTGFDDSGSAHPIHASETYTWGYIKNSLKTAALLANYDYATYNVSQLVKTDVDSERAVIYQGNGYGSLWIVNEYMYLHRDNSKENKERELFSLNMQGKNEHAYGSYEIHAMYDKYLVLVNSEETETHVVDTETGDILLPEAGAQYLYIDDDTVHFTEHPKDTDEHIVLTSVEFNATERYRLVDVRKEDVNQIVQASMNLYVNCVRTVKDKVYSSCGTHGGSASVYQGGVLAKVKKGGSNFEVLGETPTNFTVYETEGIMKYRRIDKPFQDGDKNIWIYRNNAREKLIVNGEGYYRRFTVDEYVDTRSVNMQKDVVYLSVDYSVPDGSVSIGWRTRYRLQSSVYYRKDLKTRTSERLHEFQF